MGMIKGRRGSLGACLRPFVEKPVGFSIQLLRQMEQRPPENVVILIVTNTELD